MWFGMFWLVLADVQRVIRVGGGVKGGGGGGSQAWQVMSGSLCFFLFSFWFFLCLNFIIHMFSFSIPFFLGSNYIIFKDFICIISYIIYLCCYLFPLGRGEELCAKVVYRGKEGRGKPTGRVGGQEFGESG